jgi:hypothetical protein
MLETLNAHIYLDLHYIHDSLFLLEKEVDPQPLHWLMHTSIL